MSWGKVKADKADSLFSQWVRLRDMQCLRCRKPVELNDKGLPINLQASHFQGRRKESTRYDPANVCALCPGCHRYFGENPAEHYSWQVERLGQKEVDSLVLRSNTYKKKDRKMEVLLWSQALKDILVQQKT